MVQQARTQLSLIKQSAAADNDLLQVFASQSVFPVVFQRHLELAAADKALRNLLPVLAKQVGVPKLSFTSIQNQVCCDNVALQIRGLHLRCRCFCI